MNIATVNMYDWQKFETGTGSIAVDNDRKVTITCGASSSFYISKILSAFPNEKFKVKFKARIVDGSGAGISLDYPTSGASKNLLEITGNEWKEYEISYTIPLNSSATAGNVLKISIGLFGSYEGTVEVADVVIEVENSSIPAPRVYGMCLFTINNGTVSINTGFSEMGIKQFSNATTIMTVDVEASGSSSGASPIFYAQLTSDTNLGVIAKVGGYNKTTGQVNIVFVDVNTGTSVDVSALGVFYVWFMSLGM